MRFRTQSLEAGGVEERIRERRELPQDVSIRSTTSDLEFARLRAAYLVECKLGYFLPRGGD